MLIGVRIYTHANNESGYIFRATYLVSCLEAYQLVGSRSVSILSFSWVGVTRKQLLYLVYTKPHSLDAVDCVEKRVCL